MTPGAATPTLRGKLEALLNDRVLELAAAGGGVNQTWRAQLERAGSVFVKTHDAAPPNLYACEARGLSWLAQAHALRTPRVLGHCEADAQGPACLVLERIEPGRPRADFDQRLGRGLADIHRCVADGFGLDHANYIAILPQDNNTLPDWPSFYAERRLLAQLRVANDQGRATRALRSGVESVCARMSALCGPTEPPARLHGDLWGGNLLCDDTGSPCLIDPAVYGGHREIDLAMMRLFGGFSERVFDAYAEAYPLAAGHDERVALYQLYPLLVHVNLFGGSYVAQTERVLGQLA